MATKTQIKTEIKKEPFRPKFYKVILLNDDVTTMDFVVTILVKIFEKTWRNVRRGERLELVTYGLYFLI